MPRHDEQIGFDYDRARNSIVSRRRNEILPPEHAFEVAAEYRNAPDQGVHYELASGYQIISNYAKAEASYVGMASGTHARSDIGTAFREYPRSGTSSGWQRVQSLFGKSGPYRLTAAVKALAALSTKWQMTTGEMAVLLGYEKEKDWADVLEGRAGMDEGVDRRDRIATLLRIHGYLFTVFRTDENMSKWLRSPTTRLPASPLQHMLTGRRLFHMYQVVDTIQGMTDPPSAAG